MNRLVAALTFLALVGCSQGDTPAHKAASASALRQQQGAGSVPAFGLASAASVPGTSYETRIRQQRAFADLPDRGELLSYASRGGASNATVRGAYTWHRVDVSEEHALRAIASGRLRVLAPSGQTLDIRYDRHVEHPSGDLSWIGHVAGSPGVQTILTFGAEAAYGLIGQPGKRSLRLTTRNGAGWIVETDPAKLVGLASTHSPRIDALAVPKQRMEPAGMASARQATHEVAAAAAAATTTIDLLIGYTPGFVSTNKSTSAALTRLNQLVTLGNQALINSQINAQIRLVHAMQVNYPDASDNGDTLEQLTGYDVDSEQYTTPNAAFNALRAARESYGADLVTLVRAFREPEQDGCGIAWLIGGGQSGVSPGDGQDYFGYSVVSDGEDDNYFCRPETLIHELAHNMGSQHDREAAEDGDGRLDPDDYGAFSYSFGFKTGISGGNFYTIMAYGDEGQQDYPYFSNPRVNDCGGRACGTVNDDNARSLAQLAPVVATFRQSRSVNSIVRGMIAGNFNGDRRADVLWRHIVRGQNSIWLSANVNSPQAMSTVSDLNWRIVGAGDFNRDGRSDVLWRNVANGRNSIWLSANRATPMNVTSVGDLRWEVAGVGDFNGDRRADILWRHSRSGANSIWLSGNVATAMPMNTISDLAWQIAAVDDFNGDGRTDVLWRHAVTGANSIWPGAQRSQALTVATLADPQWRAAGSGDFNGDGRSDIFWRHAGAGQNMIWYSGSSNAQVVLGGTDARWRVAEVGDFNGDGRDDVFWRHSVTGDNGIWLSANRNAAQAVYRVSDLNWLIFG